MRRSWTRELREFWRAASYHEARDTRVTVPANPAAYDGEESRRALEGIVGPLPLWTGMVVADYGCGVGRLTLPLIDAGARVFAIDVSPEMLEFTRQRCAGRDGLAAVLSDAWGCEDLVADEVCDGVICCYVLQHLPTWGLVYSIAAELRRITKAGGWCVVQFTDHGLDEAGGQVGFLGVRLRYETVAGIFIEHGWHFQGVEVSHMGEHVLRMIRPQRGEPATPKVAKC